MDRHQSLFLEKVIEQYDLTILCKKSRQSFDGISKRLINDWITCLAKVEDQRKGFNIAWTLASTSCLSEQFRDIRVVLSALQDNVLMPEDFTEYIYHVGNVIELNSIIRSGLMPGGKSPKWQAIRFSHCRTRWTIKAWKKFDATWPSKRSHHIEILGAIKSSLRRKDCNVIKHDHTQSFSTTHCLRFMLRKRYAWWPRRSFSKKFSNLHGCHEFFWSRIHKVGKRIDLIKKQENPQTTKAHRKEVTVKLVAATLTKELPGIPHFTVQQQDTNRKETVNKLMQQFENHPNKESFQQDLSKIAQVQRKVEEVDYRHEPTPWWQTWSFPNGNECTKKPKTCCRKLATPRHGGYKTIWERCPQRWQISQDFVKNCVDWRTDCSVWRTCIGRPFQNCNKRRKRS